MLKNVKITGFHFWKMFYLRSRACLKYFKEESTQKYEASKIQNLQKKKCLQCSEIRRWISNGLGVYDSFRRRKTTGGATRMDKGKFFTHLKKLGLPNACTSQQDNDPEHRCCFVRNDYSTAPLNSYLILPTTGYLSNWAFLRIFGLTDSEVVKTKN